MNAPLIRKCLFPSAGYGTRFLPASKSLPKEMMPIVNKPLLQYGVEEAMEAGMNCMVIITGRGKRAIEDYFDLNYELEDQIAGSDKERQLEELRDIMHKAVFSYTRQMEMKGLGHAILSGETLIGDQPFAVLLPDDLCYAPGQGVFSQMLELFQKHRRCIVALEDIPKGACRNFGVIAGEELEPGLFNISHAVEKPEPAEAPSNLGIIGRYILTPDIFEMIRTTPPGRDNEVQITDALATMAREGGGVLGYKFKGRRFDCGSVAGFMAATRFYYENFHGEEGGS